MHEQLSRALGMIRLSAVLLLVAGFSSSALAADRRLTFRCEGGKVFTITFHGFETASLVFAGTTRGITMENDNAGSSISYSGGGWTFFQHGDNTALNEYPGGRVYRCQEVRGR